MYVLNYWHTVNDYGEWKKIFDSDPLGREASGVRRLSIERPMDDESTVIGELEFDTLGEAETFAGRLQEVWERPRQLHGLEYGDQDHRGPRATGVPPRAGPQGRVEAPAAWTGRRHLRPARLRTRPPSFAHVPQQPAAESSQPAASSDGLRRRRTSAQAADSRAPAAATAMIQIVSPACRDDADCAPPAVDATYGRAGRPWRRAWTPRRRSSSSPTPTRSAAGGIAGARCRERHVVAGLRAHGDEPGCAGVGVVVAPGPPDRPLGAGV